MLINSYDKCNENFYNKKIIIIRGTASSGKSTLAKELGNKLDQYFMIFPVEDLIFFHMIPNKYLVDGPEAKRGFYLTRDENNDIKNVYSSEWGTEMYMTYISTFSNYIKKGLNIICDGNLIDEDSLSLLLNQISIDYEIYIFSLNVTLDILEEREKTRTSERAVGFAKHQYNKMVLSHYLDHCTLNVNSNTQVSDNVKIILDYCTKNSGSNVNEIFKKFKKNK